MGVFFSGGVVSVLETPQADEMISATHGGESGKVRREYIIWLIGMSAMWVVVGGGRFWCFRLRCVMLGNKFFP